MSRARGRAGDRESSEGEAHKQGEQPTATDRTAVRKAREKAFAAALKMLAARPRSESQLRERLLARSWNDPSVVDDCIARLKELGYLDDSRFAQNYANYRVSTKAVGRSRVARELAGKKVPQKNIEEALDVVFDEVGEEALIDRAIQKRIRTHGRPTDNNSAKRMFDYLARLGFGYDLIIRKLRALRAGAGDTPDDEG